MCYIGVRPPSAPAAPRSASPVERSSAPAGSAVRGGEGSGSLNKERQLRVHCLALAGYDERLAN